MTILGAAQSLTSQSTLVSGPLRKCPACDRACSLVCCGHTSCCMLFNSMLRSLSCIVNTVQTMPEEVCCDAVHFQMFISLDRIVEPGLCRVYALWKKYTII